MPMKLQNVLSLRTETVGEPSLQFRVRNAAAMALAAASGATDAIGYLALGHVFTSAMTGNLVLLGISLGHRNGERAGRVLVSVICFVIGAAFGARIARTPEPDDPVWPPAVTRALAFEVPLLVAYATLWWAVGADPDFAAKVVLLGLGAVAFGIQSSAMQRFGAGLNTTFLSGSLTLLVGRLAMGHRFHDVRHHLLVLVGLVCGGALGAVLVLHAPMFAPLMQLIPLAAALVAAVWFARVRRRVAERRDP
ncbi:MAG TPA: YoaK family protein [Mycobacterium sp.]|nr:YoaK family protein [Mycobacterium sp.]